MYCTLLCTTAQSHESDCAGCVTERVVLYGISLGTAITADKAQRLSDENISLFAVILMAPFLSILQVSNLPMLALLTAVIMPRCVPRCVPHCAPHCVLCLQTVLSESAATCRCALNSWLTTDKISYIKSPLLIVHGTADTVCPFKHGHTLFKKAQDAGVAATLLVAHGLTHGELMPPLRIVE